MPPAVPTPTPALVLLRFHYYEVMDRDYTLIRVDLVEGGAVTQTFTNLPETWEHAPQKEAYGNQREEFVFPTRKAALGLIRSNPRYREMNATLETYFTADWR